MTTLILHACEIPREEIEALDTAPFIDRMSSRVANPKPEDAGNFAILVDGYNDDPEEVYTIQSVRDYYKKLDEEWPYLLFFAENQWSESLQMASL